jgi:hypothetical protein
VAVNIQTRRDTAANWTTNNPILLDGEFGYEKDTGKIKIGDGVTSWNSLIYSDFTSGGGFNLVELPPVLSEPSIPLANLLVYSKNVAGRTVPKVVGPSGLDNQLQLSIAQNGVRIAAPGATTALTYFGMGAMTAVGTLSHPALTANNLRESTSRGILTSAATANSASEFRSTTTSVWRGNASTLGGFFLIFRFGISSTVAAQRLAVGLWSASGATATTIQPSTLTNAIFVGNDAADANLQLMYNDAAGSCTKIDLGSDFVKNQQNAIYELILFCKPGDTGIGWRAKRLDANGEASGFLTTDIPTTTTFLFPHYYANNGGTAAAVILDFYRFYLETDY